jgi:hypothetical protein
VYAYIAVGHVPEWMWWLLLAVCLSGVDEYVAVGRVPECMSMLVLAVCLSV